MNTAAIMNAGIVSSVNTISNTITINTSQLSSGMMSDGMSEPSSPESSFDAADLLDAHCSDEVTAQLAAAGPVGIAAAAAIASSRKKKRPHQFETNPSIRKRQQTRLIRKLKATIEEYTTRVGQQAVVLCCTPGKSTSPSSNSYKVFGSQPLETVIRNCRGVVMQDLETALAEQAPPSQENNGVYDLPPLALDGIPTPVDKMTQAQLRTFIPEMLKYSTGRSKPGWGKPECQPPWWPNDLPWANVRSDVRTDEEKKRVSWTEALRTIVKNCYKHHGREDLLNIFGDDVSMDAQGDSATAHYTGTMVQTINNPDGTVSIIQIDTGPNNVVTLPDGTQATVVHTMATLPQQQTQQEGSNHEANQAVQTLAEVASNQGAGDPGMGVQVTPIPVSIEMNADGHGLTALNDGRFVLAGDGASLTTDGSGIVTIPMSMYQSMVAAQSGISSVSAPSDSNLQIALAPAMEEIKETDTVVATNLGMQVEAVETKIEPS